MINCQILHPHLHLPVLVDSALLSPPLCEHRVESALCPLQDGDGGSLTQPLEGCFHLYLPLLMSLSLDPQFLLFLADSMSAVLCSPHGSPCSFTHKQAYLIHFSPITIPASLIPLSFNFSAETYKTSNNYGNRVVSADTGGGFQTKPLEKVNQCLLGKEDGERPIREQ